MPHIYGQLNHARTQLELPGFQVEAIYRRSGRQVLSQTATSDGKGAFTLEFSENLFAKLPPGVVIEVAFQVYRNGQALASSGGISELSRDGHQVTILVQAHEVEEALRVRGTILHFGGRPAVGVLVVALDRDLRREEMLGEVETDAEGFYEIPYARSQFHRAEKDRADLLIRVKDGSGQEVGASSIVFNAEPIQTIDLTLDANALIGPSEYERYSEELALLIEDEDGDAIQPAELTDEDLRFLAGETGISAEHLGYVRLDAQWSDQRDVDSAVFYGLFRQGLPTDYHRLLAEKPSRLRQAIEASTKQGIVPAHLADEIDRHLDRLHELAVEANFQPNGENAEGPTLGSLLSTAPGLSEDQQLAFVRFAVSWEGDGGSEFWGNLRASNIMAQDAIGAVEVTLQTSTLVLDHAPVLQALQELRLDRSWGGAIDFARLNPEELEEVVINATSARDLPSGFEDPGLYAEAIGHRIEQMFPTATVGFRLADYPDWEDHDVPTFIAANPSYDLLHTPLDDYMRNGADLDEVEDPVALVSNLKMLQRIARVAPAQGRFDVVRALLDQNLTSSQAIVRSGKDTFIQTMTPIVGETRAVLTFNTAQMRADTANVQGLAVRDLVTEGVRVLPGGLRWWGGTAPPTPTGELATWRDLFGTLNSCSCQHCRSVYSPAAYLVDLLQFLKEAPRPLRGGPVLHEVLHEVLDARRPDLRQTLLNCDNANTTLPYIDLVNEVLELEVRKFRVPLPGSRPFYQTEGSDSEAKARLRAVPVNEDADAYEILEEAQYPWILPFSLSHEKSKVFAKQLNLELYRVRELFNRPVNEGVRHYLGMSPAVWRLIVTPESNSGLVARAWGLDNLSEWNDGIPRILKRTKLSYDELRTLLDSNYLSGKGIEIDVSADPCRIELHRLFVPASERAQLLDRIHRFVRLMKALGSSVEELDIMLKLGRQEEIGSTTLLYLTQLRRLAIRLRVSPEEVAALTIARLAATLRIADSEARAVIGLDAGGFESIDLTGEHTQEFTPEQVRIFLDRREGLAVSGIDVSELGYLLHDVDTAPPAFAPTATMLDQELDLLLRAIQTVQPESLGSRPPGPPADEAVAAFEERLRGVEDAIGQHVASRLGVDPALIRTLLGSEAYDEGGAITPGILRSHGASGRSGIADFVDLVSEPGPVGALRNGQRMWLRLAKSTRLAGLLELSAREIVLGDQLRTATVDWMDWNSLPIRLPDESDSVSPAPLSGVEAWLRVKRLQREMPRGDLDILDYLTSAGGTDLPSFLGILASGTGWNSNPRTGMLDDAISIIQSALGGVTLEAFRRLETYEGLLAAMSALRRLNVSPTDWVLIGTADGATLAETLARVAESRHGERRLDWYKALTPAMDQLREAKRDALVAYLTTKRRWPDANQLYADFLIDVDMSACQLTSRIVQANSAIQLFVQRCLLNLESQKVQVSSPANRGYWARWEWMKNYRVWEANRKVFLYPENWIEPDLRDDKSPFFKDLENELLQHEVTQEAVERAYTNYFAKLDDVARLDVRGLYEEEVEGRGKSLHVVARTFSEPHNYYYRSRSNDRVWSAWERIDLTIEGDHAIPLVHNGRLMLFWATFKEEVEPKEAAPASEAIALPAKINLSIRWTTYMNGGWLPPRGSKLEVELSSVTSPHFSLRTSDDGELRIFIKKWGSFVINGETSYGKIWALVWDDRLGILRPGDAIDPVPRWRAPYNTQFSTDVYHGPDSDLILDLGGWHRERGVVYLLGGAVGHYSVLPTHQPRTFSVDDPFVVQIADRSYLITHVRYDQEVALFAEPHPAMQFRQHARTDRVTYDWYRFENLYHPYMSEIVKPFRAEGAKGVLDAPASAFEVHRQLYREGQRYDSTGSLMPLGDSTRFEEWAPQAAVWRDDKDNHSPFPYEEFDFSWDGAYSVYNWELFFHIPLLAADRLSKNQRFEEAQRWFHYIFDPTDLSAFRSPTKFWKVKPLFEMASLWEEAPETLEEMVRRLSAGTSTLDEQVKRWRDNPFNPHLIARLRLIAYMKTVVQKYLDNLISWGDQLFQQDTIESINEATQLYMLASEILGALPTAIEGDETQARTYTEIEDGLDEFSNFLNEIDSSLPVSALPSVAPGTGETPPNLVLYFCIPLNEKLAGYWNIVSDRLFKVRHCMNIEGQVRQLALFAPAIDPALLVRARSMGLDLGDVLAQAVNVRLPHHRYQYLQQKALEFTGEVRALGGALLTTLEKRDAEELSLLRSRHETSLLSLSKLVRSRQVEESAEALEAARASRKLAEKRLEFYSSQERMNAYETSQADNLGLAHDYENAAQGLDLAASIAYALPDITAGLSAGVKWGGTNVGNALRGSASVSRLIASQHTYDAGKASLQGGYERRESDWNLQADLAQRELDQIDKQILAAEIRLAMAELERANHEKQLEQAVEAETFLRNKFTNTQLYGWMAAHVAALHYQAYRMAHELAKSAERAAQHELGLPASEFAYINFGHWDSQKKGLLAGDRLHQELRRMDLAYTEQNRREYEITKHVSLALLNPQQLIELRETGACTFIVPELLFDLDFPGHYRRRLKSVSMTIPCVTGPYTSISAKLTLESSWIRWTTGNPGDPLVMAAGAASIVTGSAQAANGLFEMNFRDERYLPFEGAGAISQWKMELPAELRPFDYDSISDVVLHVQYTASEDGGDFKTYVKNRLTDELDTWLDDVAGTEMPMYRMFSLRQDFASSLHRFLHPDGDQSVHEARVTVEERHMPYFLRERSLTVVAAHVVLQPSDAADHDHFVGLTLRLSRDEFASALDSVPTGLSWGGLPAVHFPDLQEVPEGAWALSLDPDLLLPDVTVDIDGRRRLNPAVVEDLVLVLQYRVLERPNPRT